ncbi:hypothetical protein [Methylibium petroleiphilum]|uniref:hypothetical protein n=1 Tax=Methylibium petroleiphilum TaxID=105560 RepID=UPI003D27EF81
MNQVLSGGDDMSASKVLVGVMYSGENEYERCLQSIKLQKGVDVELFAIENTPNKEAHDRLYDKFNTDGDRCDLIVKIDADMILLDDFALHRVVRLFKDNGSLDHLMIDVHDYLSDMPIPSMNFYSNRVKWRGNDENLIVDYHGSYSGPLIRIMDGPIANHMSDPGLMQAFYFGIHRCLKAIQPERRKKDVGRAMLHWSIITRIFESYLRLGDVRRLLAMGGAHFVLNHPNPIECLDYKSDRMSHQCKEFRENRSEADLAELLEDWRYPLKMQKLWFSKLSKS